MKSFYYRQIGLCSLCLLSACSMFEAKKLDIDGERVAVLQESKMLAPDFEEGQLKITLPRPYLNNSWKQSGGNSMHRMEHLQASQSLKKLWKANIGTGSSKRDYLLAAPVVAYKVVFTIDADAQVKALRLDDGEEIWHRNLKPLIKDEYEISMKGAGLAEFNKKIYATTGFGSVFALDMKNGREIWRHDGNTPIRIAPTVANGLVFVQTIDNTLKVLDAENGNLIWDYKAATEDTTLVGGASPAYDPFQDVVIAAFTTGELKAFKASTGSELWSTTLASLRRTNSLSTINGIKANPIIDGDVVYAFGHTNVLTAIDLRTGNRIWDREIGGISQPWVAGKYIFVLDNSFNLLAIEKSSGKIVWNTNIPVNNNEENTTGIYAKGPVLAGNRLLVSSSNGYVFAVSPYNGKIIGYISLSDGVNVAPVIARGIALFTTNDADLIAYK